MLVLGLVKEDNRSAIDVNFDLSVAEVYSQAAAKIMQDTGNLHPLTFADPQTDETPELPLWCYDWGTTSLFDPNPYGRELFTACSGGLTKVKLHPTLLRMIRRGRKVVFKSVLENISGEDLQGEFFNSTD